MKKLLGNSLFVLKTGKFMEFNKITILINLAFGTNLESTLLRIISRSIIEKV